MKLPEGYRAITPYFTVSNADQFLEFLVDAFDATIITKKLYPNGKIQHARALIGDSIIMLNESNAQYPANQSQMHLYVDDVDTVFSKALSAGAASLMEPNVRPHGNRMAGVRDPLENIWWIATHEN